MRRILHSATIGALFVILFSLAACGVQPGATSAPEVIILLGTPMVANVQSAANDPAVSTAEIVRASAQETLDSANATLGAAQTQDQNSVNIIAAQIAATAEIVHANAQATLNAASSTQNTALTQDASRQTQVRYVLQVTEIAGTQSAEAMLTQQVKNDLASSTQTAIANTIATQDQSAVATSQWYTDQTRQRDEERQRPITFLWVWCLPIFLVLLAGLILWGFWRWQKIQQVKLQILENSVDRLQPPAESLPALESNVIDIHPQPAKPVDQVYRWMDEVKQKLQSRDKKDEDDV